MNRRPNRTLQKPPLYCMNCGKKTKVTNYPGRYNAKTGEPIMTIRRECTGWFCGWAWWQTPGEKACSSLAI